MSDDVVDAYACGQNVTSHLEGRGGLDLLAPDIILGVTKQYQWQNKGMEIHPHYLESRFLELDADLLKEEMKIFHVENIDGNYRVILLFSPW